MVCLKGIAFSLLLHCLLHGFGVSATTPTTADPCYNKENGYTIVYTQNCSKFYVCLNESPFVAECPNGTFYNPRIGKCDSAISSDACVKLNKGDICCDKELGSIISYPNDLHKYVICQYPLPKIVQCPDKKIFDVRTNTCVQLGEVPECSKLPENSKWEYMGNCHVYYTCAGKPIQAYVYECSQGQLYNPKLDRCVLENQYDCPW